MPRVHLLGVWLEPRVEVEVMLSPARDSVTIVVGAWPYFNRAVITIQSLRQGVVTLQHFWVCCSSERRMLNLQASECHLRGSDLVERLRLDERFCLSFTTRLTWSPAPPVNGRQDTHTMAETALANDSSAAAQSVESSDRGFFGALSRFPRPFGGNDAALAGPAPQAQIHVRCCTSVCRTCA